MTKTATNNGSALLALWAAMMVLTGPALAAEPRDLFAHGVWGYTIADNPMWLATVEVRNGAPQTTVLVREQLKDSATGATQWVAMAPVNGRIIDLTSQSTEAVLLRGRTSPNAWMWISQSRCSYGPSLPDRAEIIDMAGDRPPGRVDREPAKLWALGRIPSATTRAATTSPVASTQPLTPILYQLKGEMWVIQTADWPSAVHSANVEDISMAIIDDKPTLAVPLDGNQVQLLQLAENGWIELQRHKTAHPYKYLKLLSLDNRPAVWMQSDDNTDRIWAGTREFSLPIPGPAPRPQDVAVTVAGDQIRLFWKRDKKVLEQRYDKDGAPQGQEVEVRISRDQEGQMQWAIIAVAAIAGILILNVILRRRAMMRDRQERDDEDEE